MDALTTSVLASFVYDICKHGAALTFSSLKEKLSSYKISDHELKALTEKLNGLDNLSNSGRSEIVTLIESNQELVKLISSFQSGNKNVTINQTNIDGDNNISISL